MWQKVMNQMTPFYCEHYAGYPLNAQHIDGLMKDCSNSIANTLELLQSCTEP